MDDATATPIDTQEQATESAPLAQDTTPDISPTISYADNALRAMDTWGSLGSSVRPADIDEEADSPQEPDAIELANAVALYDLDPTAKRVIDIAPLYARYTSAETRSVPGAQEYLLGQHLAQQLSSNGSALPILRNLIEQSDDPAERDKLSNQLRRIGSEAQARNMLGSLYIKRTRDAYRQAQEQQRARIAAAKEQERQELDTLKTLIAKLHAKGDNATISADEFAVAQKQGYEPADIQLAATCIRKLASRSYSMSAVGLERVGAMLGQNQRARDLVLSYITEQGYNSARNRLSGATSGITQGITELTAGTFSALRAALGSGTPEPDDSGSLHAQTFRAIARRSYQQGYSQYESEHALNLGSAAKNANQTLIESTPYLLGKYSPILIALDATKQYLNTEDERLLEAEEYNRARALEDWLINIQGADPRSIRHDAESGTTYYRIQGGEEQSISYQESRSLTANHIGSISADDYNDASLLALGGTLSNVAIMSAIGKAHSATGRALGKLSPGSIRAINRSYLAASGSAYLGTLGTLGIALPLATGGANAALESLVDNPAYTTARDNLHHLLSHDLRTADYWLQQMLTAGLFHGLQQGSGAIIARVNNARAATAAVDISRKILSSESVRRIEQQPTPADTIRQFHQEFARESADPAQAGQLASKLEREGKTLITRAEANIWASEEIGRYILISIGAEPGSIRHDKENKTWEYRTISKKENGSETVKTHRLTEQQAADLFLIKYSETSDIALETIQENLRSIRSDQDTAAANLIIQADTKLGGRSIDLLSTGAPEILVPLHASNGIVNRAVRRGIAEYIRNTAERANALFRRGVALAIEPAARRAARMFGIAEHAPSDIDTPSMVLPATTGHHIMLYVSGRGNLRAHLNDIIQRNLRDTITYTAQKLGTTTSALTRGIWKQLERMQSEIARQLKLPDNWLLGNAKEYSEAATIEAFSRLAISKFLADSEHLRLSPDARNYIDYITTTLESLRSSVELARHLRDWQNSTEGQAWLQEPGRSITTLLELSGLKTGHLLEEASRARTRETEAIYQRITRDIPEPTTERRADTATERNTENTETTEPDGSRLIPGSDNITGQDLRLPAAAQNPAAPESSAENHIVTYTVEQTRQRLQRTFRELLAYRQTNELISQLERYIRNNRRALAKSKEPSNIKIAEALAITNGLIATFKHNPLLRDHMPAERAKNGRPSLLANLITIQQHFAKLWQRAEKGGEAFRMSESSQQEILEAISNIERETIRPYHEQEIERDYIKEHYIDLLRDQESSTSSLITELTHIATDRSDAEREQLKQLSDLIGKKQAEEISIISRIVSYIKHKHSPGADKKVAAAQYRNILRKYNAETQKKIKTYIRDRYKSYIAHRDKKDPAYQETYATLSDIREQSWAQAKAFLEKASQIVSQHRRALLEPEANPDKIIGQRLLEIAKQYKVEHMRLVRNIIDAFGRQKRDDETIANARAALELIREADSAKRITISKIADYIRNGRLSAQERASEEWQNYLNRRLDEELLLQRAQPYTRGGNLRAVSSIREAVKNHSSANLLSATDSILNLFASSMREAIKDQLLLQVDRELARYQRWDAKGRAAKPLIGETHREQLELYRDLLDISGSEKSNRLEQLRDILAESDKPEDIRSTELISALEDIRLEEERRGRQGRYNRDIIAGIDHLLEALRKIPEREREHAELESAQQAKRDAIDYLVYHAAITKALGNYRGMSLSSAEAAVDYILRTSKRGRKEQTAKTITERNARAATAALLAAENERVHGTINTAELAAARTRHSNNILLQGIDTISGVKSYAQALEYLKGSGLGRGKGNIYKYWHGHVLRFAKLNNQYNAQAEQNKRDLHQFLTGSGEGQLNLSKKDAEKLIIQLKQTPGTLRYTLNSQQKTTVNIPTELARELITKGKSESEWNAIIQRAQNERQLAGDKAPRYDERALLEEAYQKSTKRDPGTAHIPVTLSGRVSKSVNLSYDQALNLLLLNESGEYARNMEYWGYTQEILEHMRETLRRDFDSRYKRQDGVEQHDIIWQYGDWMRQQLDNPQRHALYEELTGHPMSLTENYWSGHFIENGKEKELAEYDQGRSPKTIRYRDTIARRSHLAEPNHELGATQVYAMEYDLQNRYIHFAKYCAEMRQMLAQKTFAQYLERELGYAQYRRFKDSIDAIDGVTPIEVGLYSGLNKILKKFFAIKAVDALTARVTTLMKQGSALFNAGAWENVSVIDMCSQLLLDAAGQGRISLRQLAHSKAFAPRIKENEYIDKILSLQGENPHYSRLYHTIAKAGGRAIEYSDFLMNLIGSKHLYNLMWRRLAAEKRAENKARGIERELSEEEKSELDRACEDIVIAQLELSAQPLNAMSRSMQALTNPNLFIANLNFMGGEVINKLGMTSAIWGRERNETAYQGSAYERAASIGKRIATTYSYYALYNIVDQLIMVAIDALKGNLPTDDQDKLRPYLIGNALMALSGGTMLNYYPVAGKAVSTIIEKSVGKRTFVGDAYSELSTLNQLWESVVKINKALDAINEEAPEREDYYTLVEGSIALANAASVMLGLGYLGSSSVIGNAMSGAALTMSASGNLINPFVKGMKNDALWTRNLPEPLSRSEKERAKEEKARTRRKRAKARREAREERRRTRREARSE